MKFQNISTYLSWWIADFSSPNVVHSIKNSPIAVHRRLVKNFWTLCWACLLPPRIWCCYCWCLLGWDYIKFANLHFAKLTQKTFNLPTLHFTKPSFCQPFKLPNIKFANLHFAKLTRKTFNVPNLHIAKPSFCQPSFYQTLFVQTYNLPKLICAS